jgi:uncharacterized membrane protein
LPAIAAEALGVLLILGGFIVAAARFVPLRANSDTSAYLRLRHDLGRAILLGLEVLIAADIIRTVAFNCCDLAQPRSQDLATLRSYCSYRTGSEN